MDDKIVISHIKLVVLPEVAFVLLLCLCKQRRSILEGAKKTVL